MRFLLLTLLIFCSMTLNSQAEIIKTKLDNGATLIFKKVKGIELASINLFVKASSLNEDLSNFGIARVCASMLLKGTKTRSAYGIAESVESIGARIGASSMSDYTVLNYLSLSKHLERGFEIISDVLQNATFPEDELKKVKVQMVAAINQIEDTPNSLAYDELLHLIYKNHPYGYKDKFKIKNINNFTVNDIKNFYKNYYVPENFIISIVGDVDKQKVIEQCDKYFAFKSIKNSGKITNFPDNIKRNQQKIIKKQDLTANWINIGYLGTPIDHPDHYIIKMISSILGSGMSSRLFVVIREKQSLAYSIGSYYPSMYQTSPLIIYAVCSTDNLEKVKSLIFKEINRLKNETIPEKELLGHKNALKGKFIINQQELSQKSWILGWLETIGVDYKRINQYNNLIDAITPQDIKRVANKYLNYHSILIVGPKSK